MKEKRKYRIVPGKNYYNQPWLTFLIIFLSVCIFFMLVLGGVWTILALFIIFFSVLFLIDVRLIKMGKKFKKIWNKYKIKTYKEKIQ